MNLQYCAFQGQTHRVCLNKKPLNKTCELQIDLHEQKSNHHRSYHLQDFLPSVNMSIKGQRGSDVVRV